jgi:CBS domain-containing protein
MLPRVLAAQGRRHGLRTGIALPLPSHRWETVSAKRGRARRRPTARRLPSIDGMAIERWMKRTVVTVQPADSAMHARLLEEHRINQLPVVVDDRLVGIVTDRDLRDVFPSLAERLAPGRGLAVDPSSVPVADVMSANVLSLPPSATVAEAARLMRRERIGAIPVDAPAGASPGRLARPVLR